MSNAVSCPSCGGQIENMPHLANRHVNCPYCRQLIAMPPLIARRMTSSGSSRPSYQQPRGQSVTGILSVVFAGASFVCLVAAFLAASSSLWGIAFGMALYVGSTTLAGLGVIFGLAGMLAPKRSHTCAVVGFILSAMLAILTGWITSTTAEAAKKVEQEFKKIERDTQREYDH